MVLQFHVHVCMEKVQVGKQLQSIDTILLLIPYIEYFHIILRNYWPLSRQ